MGDNYFYSVKMGALGAKRSAIVRSGCCRWRPFEPDRVSRTCRAAPRSRRSSLFISSDGTVQAAQLFSYVLSAGGAGSFKRARALLRQTVQLGPRTELALQPSTHFNGSLEPPKEPRKGCSLPLLVAATVTVFGTAESSVRERKLAAR